MYVIYIFTSDLAHKLLLERQHVTLCNGLSQLQKYYDKNMDKNVMLL